MTTTNNITNFTVTMNIYNNPDQTITPRTKLLENNSQTVYIPTKVCKTCNTIKCVTEFYNRKTSKDGYYNRCKNCMYEERKEYYDRNKNQILNEQKEYYNQNKTKIIEQKHEYYNINKDRISNKRKQNYN